MEPLAKLFGSSARLKTLRLFVFNQDTAFTLAEVVVRAKLAKDTARHELADLVAVGFLRKRGTHGAAKYQVQPKFEYLAPLDSFIRETTSVRPQAMLSTLRRAGTLQLVALSGLFTGIVESTIDLLVVGDSLDERQLTAAVRGLEAELGREIRFAFFATPDFRYRVEVYDRLVRDVFDYPHRLLLDKIGV